MYKLKWGTHSLIEDGSRVRYHEGDIIENVPQRHLKKWPDRFEKIEEEKNIDELLEEYYSGRGWYKLPSMDKSVRKEEAFEILGDIDG